LRKSVPRAPSRVLERGRRTVIDFESNAVARLFDAAETVFANEGFAGASMDQIATLAGLNKATIYYHIGNKEKLYQEILKRHFSRFADRLERELADCEDPLEGLRGIVRIHAEEYSRSRASTRTIAHELADGLSRTGAEVRAIVWRILGVTKRYVDTAGARGLLPPLDLLSVHYLLVGPLILHEIVIPVAPTAAEPPSDWRPPESTLAAMQDLIARIVVPALAGR